MNEENNLIKVFIGAEASAILLKARLEKIGILALIKNDSSSAFLGVVPALVDLYIQESDLKEVKPIIDEFIENSKS